MIHVNRMTGIKYIFSVHLLLQTKILAIWKNNKILAKED